MNVYIGDVPRPVSCPSCGQCWTCGRPVIQPVIRPGTPYWRPYYTTTSHTTTDD